MSVAGSYFGFHRMAVLELHLSNVFMCMQHGITALMHAGYSRNADCAKLLLDAGAEKNATSDVRCQPVALHYY